MKKICLILPVMMLSILFFNCSVIVPAFADAEPSKSSSTINDVTIGDNQRPYIGQISYRNMSNSIYIWKEVEIIHFCHNGSWGWEVDILNKNNTLDGWKLVPYLNLTPSFQGTEGEETIEHLWIYMDEGLKEPNA